MLAIDWAQTAHARRTIGYTVTNVISLILSKNYIAPFKVTT